MTVTSHTSLSSAARAISLRLRRDLSPGELANRRVRRRLLEYIVANHRRRLAARGRALLEARTEDEP